MISRRLAIGVACAPLCALAQATAEPITEKVQAVVMSDHTTYLVTAAGGLYLLGEVSLWASHLKGAKGCPVLYSLCSDTPLRVSLPFLVKSLATSGGLTFLLSTTGAVTLHGFNDEGKVGIDFSGDVRIASRRFNSVGLDVPEPVEHIASSPQSLFLVGRSGALYRADLKNLRSAPGAPNPVQRVEGVAPIRTVKSSRAGTVAQDTAGQLWDVADSAGRAIRIELSGRSPAVPARPVIDYAFAGPMLYVLESTPRHRVACYRMLLSARRPPKAWTPAGCPDGADGLSLPEDGAMRLVPLAERHVAVRHEQDKVTFVAKARELHYSMPWLQITDQGVIPRWQIYSHGQRQVLVDGEIRLVGDNSFTQSGLPDGRTVITPTKLKGFEWAL